MKDAHQRIDVKETDCPTTEESRLALSLYVCLLPSSAPQVLQLQYGFLRYLNPKPPLTLFCLLRAVWMISIGAASDKHVGLMEERRPLWDGAGPVLERGGGG